MLEKQRQARARAAGRAAALRPDRLRLAAALVACATLTTLLTAPARAAESTGVANASPLYNPNGFYHPFNWTFYQGAQELRALGRSGDADTIDRLAAQQTSRWLTGHHTDAESLRYLLDGGWMDKGSVSTGTTPVIVVYNIPHRDCGSYSSGGSNDASAYRQWIDGISSMVGNRRIAVVLEPDALSVADCLSDWQQSERWSLIRYATEAFRQRNPQAVTYIAAMTGFSDVSKMAARLKASGIDNTRGFALNVADFETTPNNIAYGETLRRALGTDAKFIVDTSRNGSGRYPGTGEAVWCNPPGRTIGERPTMSTGRPNVDAFLWIKDQTTDGGCWNSNPVAHPYEYTLDIAKRSGV